MKINTDLEIRIGDYAMTKSAPNIQGIIVSIDDDIVRIENSYGAIIITTLDDVVKLRMQDLEDLKPEPPRVEPMYNLHEKIHAQVQESLQPQDPYEPTQGELDSRKVNHPDYYNRYSVEVVEMARRIWGNEAMKTAAEITAFIYRMRAGVKEDNPVEQDLNKEQWWLDYITRL